MIYLYSHYPPHTLQCTISCCVSVYWCRVCEDEQSDRNCWLKVNFWVSGFLLLNHISDNVWSNDCVATQTLIPEIYNFVSHKNVWVHTVMDIVFALSNIFYDKSGPAYPVLTMVINDNSKILQLNCTTKISAWVIINMYMVAHQASHIDRRLTMCLMHWG